MDAAKIDIAKIDVAKIKSRALSLAEEMTRLRRHFHENPELPWQEMETSRLIASKLEELGLNPQIGVGDQPVGVVADLAGNASGPCVALRADIDAFAITEETDVPYKSCKPGVMHACGHDGHITMLLAAAKLLSEMKDQLPGRVRFIFQPAEEHGYRSGAQAMINDGVLEGVSSIAGMHLWSDIPSGKAQWRAGPTMASADGWKVVFKGKGGHGAAPHVAIDPTLAAAAFIFAVQTLVSRETNPLETVVVSVGKLESGRASNVIPELAEMVGTVRTFNRAVRDGIEERFQRMAEGVGATYRCKAETRYEGLYPYPVVNDAALTRLFRDTAVRVVGEENLGEAPLRMSSEDFSFYQAEIPGCFFFVGSGNEAKGCAAPHHSPHFNIDDDSLPTGVALLTSFACAMLGSKKGEIEG
ncbi:MAG: amidohydrolase [Synergistaceae bacterium]|jgi:amidohydrolase|nr:amidohydrolase [Synergistaceae bacterium]